MAQNFGDDVQGIDVRRLDKKCSRSGGLNEAGSLVSTLACAGRHDQPDSEIKFFFM